MFAVFYLTSPALFRVPHCRLAGDSETKDLPIWMVLGRAITSAQKIVIVELLYRARSPWPATAHLTPEPHSHTAHPPHLNLPMLKPLSGSS